MMNQDIKIDKTIDLKNLPCPMPLVKISKGIKEVNIGQVVEAVATDPGTLADFPAWAKTSGNEILKTDQNNGVIRFYIKRNA
jgi:tRNA 2-thiouridine synthesizing protein A